MCCLLFAARCRCVVAIQQCEWFACFRVHLMCTYCVRSVLSVRSAQTGIQFTKRTLILPLLACPIPVASITLITSHTTTHEDGTRTNELTNVLSNASFWWLNSSQPRDCTPLVNWNIRMQCGILGLVVCSCVCVWVRDLGWWMVKERKMT